DGIRDRNVTGVQTCALPIFAECDGLEMTMEVKTIKEGGANGRLIRLIGPVNYGQLTLKRGMTANFDLWNWFTQVVADPTLRANVEVVMQTKTPLGDESTAC